MAYPAPFMRLVVSGSLYGVESFSWGLSLVPNFGEGTVPDTVPSGIVNAVQTFHTATSNVASAARLQTIKYNLIGPDGRYASASDTVQHDFASPGVAGAGTTSPPPQVSLAVTLMTDARRGRASRGRFYVPLPTRQVGADGRISTADAQAVATAATTMLNSINASAGGWVVGVASDIGDGAFRRVTHVEVGRVLDTVRSRRTSLPEDRQVGADLATA